MKKIMLFAAVLLTAGYASAQVSYQLGFIATAEESTTSIGAISTTSKNNYSGFMVGADYNINLAGGLNVAPGLEMEFSLDKRTDALNNDIKYKEFDLLVPVDFNYGFDLGQALKLYVFAGPTFDLGLMSKIEDNDQFDHGKKRFDILLGPGVWVDINDLIRVKAGYKWGMLDLFDNDNTTWKRNRLTLSVGYIF